MLLIIYSKVDQETREKVAEDLKGYIKVVVDVNRMPVARNMLVVSKDCSRMEASRRIFGVPA